HSTGAAGVIAVYVFSTDGNAKGTLRAVFRSQRLFRAVTAITGASLRIDTAKYDAGDELCCPSELTRRVYVWSAKAHEFRRASLTKRVCVGCPLEWIWLGVRLPVVDTSGIEGDPALTLWTIRNRSARPVRPNAHYSCSRPHRLRADDDAGHGPHSLGACWCPA